ncbi:unnamed protein product [Rotaria socialis]|uniref:Uncharacterized protein n=2 Tax=Rotaria socialis TaxID=392032 RepID=A0A818IEF7_9BILA|nr:unnamed protein product [Rotaria socialis]CAF3518440.1 unnamed protein product [Rotaria socialis]CAF3556420.1 unnamed protein product [Rotaria socialis]CAF3744583.1 unnamed protein product [Rotaria socialis]CAF4202118.1 unnamed protein product [Rotaria socialis]
MVSIKRYNGSNQRCTTLFLDKFAHRDQYGFLKDVRQEKIEDFTSINSISSLDNDRLDAELDRINTELADMLRGLELRKRAYYVNMPNFVYVVGGYLFDPIQKERRAPSNDWRWDIEEKKLEKIPPIPPGHGRINFGIAANNGKLVVIGGNTIINRPTDTCYIYGQNDDQWEMLPSLPNPLCGPAVALDDKDCLYVFGGYDLLAGHTLFRNDFLKLEDLSSEKWTILKNSCKIENKSLMISPRARTLLVACGNDVIPPDGGLFACGGYAKSSSGELIPVSEILCYNRSKKDWTYLSDIPNLKKLNIIAVDNNILVISDKIKSNNPDEEDQFIPISKYDLMNKKWLMINQKDISNVQVEETKTDS